MNDNLNEWESNTMNRIDLINDDFLMSDTLDLVKSEIFKAMQELDETPSKLSVRSDTTMFILRELINSILESRNIKERI